eukprot:1512619-Rhodomonas_salina.1
MHGSIHMSYAMPGTEIAQFTTRVGQFEATMPEVFDSPAKSNPFSVQTVPCRRNALDLAALPPPRYSGTAGESEPSAARNVWGGNCVG